MFVMGNNRYGISLEEVILEVPRTTVMEYHRGINRDRLYWNLYVSTHFPGTSQGGRAGFVLQDRLCRLLTHMIKIGS